MIERGRGEDTEIIPPIEYAIMKYRQYFGLSWRQFVDTPVEVYLRDCELMAVEAEVEAALTKMHKEELEQMKTKK